MSLTNEESYIFIQINYKAKRNDKTKLRIFGEIFVKNNKDKYKIMFKDKEYKLTEYFDNIDKNYNHKDDVILELIINDGLIDLSYMFAGCNTLLTFFESLQSQSSKLFVMNEINKEDEQSLVDDENNNNDNLENNFYGEEEKDKNKISYPNPFSSEEQQISSIEFKFSSMENYDKNLISKINIRFNFSNIIGLSYIFYGCSSLISLPDISNWNISNVKNISNMFNGCNSLISLPDISKWNTGNVNDMSWMFYECNSVISLSDISNWNTEKVNNMSNMFNGCTSLISLPDISKWNASDCKSMKGMFSDCLSLTSLPDLSKWNVSNVNDISYMFNRCKSLKSFPDISKWDTENINDINNMFEKCSSLISIPDISNWKHKNITSIINLFEMCKSLKSLPDLSKWKIPMISEIKDISYYESLCPLKDLFKQNNFIEFNLILDQRNKEINLKFINPQNNNNESYESIFKKEGEELCGLLKLCLLKEIAEKIVETQIKEFPELLSNILKILKNSFFEEKNEKEIIINTLKEIKGSNIINFSKYIDRIDKTNKFPLIDNLLSLIKKKKEFKIINYINNIKKHFLNYNEYIKAFESDFEIRKKESIFEFSIISLVIIGRQNLEIFEEERKKCPNRVDKILYHGTQIEPISLILKGEYKKSEKSAKHGKGVYFTDSLDYCWYYGGDDSNKNNISNKPKNRANIDQIPEIGETFTFIANAIYYKKEGFRRVIDFKYTPTKNEINFAYATGNCNTIYGDPDKTKVYGTEYVIGESEQICPLLGAKLKRNEYCVIWRDDNFSLGPVYNNEYDDIFKNFLSERMKNIEQYAELNIYTCKKTEEALELVERKKYNKIILISNVGRDNEGQKFIKRARKIIGKRDDSHNKDDNNSNKETDVNINVDNDDADTDGEIDDNDGVISFFLAYNEKHLKDIMYIKNALFSNRADFFEEYLWCFSDKVKDEDRESEIKKLKKKIEDYYKIEFDFNEDFLYFPQFKNVGLYSALKFKGD